MDWCGGVKKQGQGAAGRGFHVSGQLQLKSLGDLRLDNMGQGRAAQERQSWASVALGDRGWCMLSGHRTEAWTRQKPEQG